jgi:hypothetical protein
VTKFSCFVIIPLYIAKDLEISLNCVSFVVKVKFFHLKKVKAIFFTRTQILLYVARGRHVFFCFEAICERYNIRTALSSSVEPIRSVCYRFLHCMLLYRILHCCLRLTAMK